MDAHDGGWEPALVWNPHEHCTVLSHRANRGFGRQALRHSGLSGCLQCRHSLWTLLTSRLLHFQSGSLLMCLGKPWVVARVLHSCHAQERHRGSSRLLVSAWPRPTIVPIWGVNQQMEYLSLPLSL